MSGEQGVYNVHLGLKDCGPNIKDIGNMFMGTKRCNMGKCCTKQFSLFYHVNETSLYFYLLPHIAILMWFFILCL